VLAVNRSSLTSLGCPVEFDILAEKKNILFKAICVEHTLYLSLKLAHFILANYASFVYLTKFSDSKA
jgi:hypothetical protein